MRKKWITVVLAAFALIVSLCFFAGCAEKTAKKTTVKKAEWGNASDFTLKKVGGGTFTLSSLQGKVILLNFWATWCGYCVDEIPDLISLKDTYGKDLEIVGVSMDDKGEAAVKPFAEKAKINYVLVLADDKISKQYGNIRGLPTTFIIDRAGNISDKIIGSQSKEEFEKDILKVMGKPK